MPRHFQQSPPPALRPQLLPCLHPRGLEWSGWVQGSLYLPTVPRGARRGVMWLLPPWCRGRAATIGCKNLSEVWGVIVSRSPSAPSGKASIQHPPVGGAAGGHLPAKVPSTHRDIPLLLCRWEGVRVRWLSPGRKPCSAQSESTETSGWGSEGELEQ